MTWIDKAIFSYEYESRQAIEKAEALKEMQKKGAVRDLLKKLRNVDTILEVWQFMKGVQAPKNVTLWIGDVKTITRGTDGEIESVNLVNEKYGVNHSIEWNYEIDDIQVVAA